ncbi:hypothetical protein TRV_00721 [Trichophyton verrucosum HKI 0517]|uniref:Uncharacterized protein n=1 Tax=Trichophyton verrucosum (strain HKI 0517) TaxID=663202 RepID=D4D0X5_TRIVH|nr:uncharacterized protein TRV_00721 [Trichophyton verrucosum HKI 0517]EFE44452.1 hypothetical protein TRV_00721 [Trichophyton verrucosum HKI 0517]
MYLHVYQIYAESVYRSMYNLYKPTVPRPAFSSPFLYLTLFIFIFIFISFYLYLSAFVVAKNCADHMTFSRSGKSKHQLLDFNFNFDFSLLLLVFLSSSFRLLPPPLLSVKSSLLPRRSSCPASPPAPTLAGYPSGRLRRWVGRT